METARVTDLATTDTQMSLVDEQRPLEPLVYRAAELVVRRVGETTYYECSLPWDEMRQAIQPAEGREFCLSVLVHDPGRNRPARLGRSRRPVGIAAPHARLVQVARRAMERQTTHGQSHPVGPVQFAILRIGCWLLVVGC